MAGIHFDITGDNRNFLSALHGAEQGVRQTSAAVAKEGGDIESLFSKYGDNIQGLVGKIQMAMATTFAGFTVAGFAQKIASVRGEFQQLEVAFETMLGSAEQAGKMMDDMTRLAATTPFDLKGVANGAKQLLAYGMEADKVEDTLRRLGDVAAGLGIQIGDLTYLYGTTMAQGRMYTQDLNQFTGRGIPMLRELAAQFGVAESEVKGLVESGKIGFPEVEKVIKSLTDEGGQFGGLMEAQSHTITGQISNIEDSLDMMFNEMGKSSEGAINTVLSGVSYAVEHYQELGTAVLGVVAALGEWKAAAVIVNAWNKMLADQTAEIEETRHKALSGVYEKYSKSSDSGSTSADTAAQEQNTLARNANKTAIDQQIAALEAEMKAQVATAAAKERAAAEEVAAGRTILASEQELLALREKEYAAALESGDGISIETAEKARNSQANEVNAASQMLCTAEEHLATAATAKNTATTRLSTMQTEIDATAKRANATATGLMAAVTNTATKAMNGLKMACATNPVGAVIAGVTVLLSLMPMFASATEEASAEVTRFGEAAVKQTNDVNTLFAVMEGTSETSNVHKKAVEDLTAVYEEYGIHINKEKDQLSQLVAAHDELIAKIREEGEERQKANLLQSYTEAMDQTATSMRETLEQAFKDAEKITGTGFNTDVKEYQEKAQQMATIVSGIISSEAEGLQQIVRQGGEVSATAMAEAVTRIREKIAEAGKSMGMSVNALALDVDYQEIMDDYLATTLNLTGAQEQFVKTMRESKGAAEEQTEAVGFADMTLDDLRVTARSTSDALDDVGGADVKPEIDSTSIESAGVKLGETKKELFGLDGLTVKPTVNTMSIDLALSKTGQLLTDINRIANTDFKFNVPGLNANAPSMGYHGLDNVRSFNYLSGKQETNWATLRNAVSAAQTNNDVAKTKKKLQELLDDAEYGTTEYKELDKLVKELDERKKKNSGKTKNKKKTGKTTVEKTAEAQHRLDDLLEDSSRDLARRAEDLESRVSEARLAARESGAATLRAQQEQENREELRRVEREKEDAIKAYVDAEEKIWEQREKVRKAKNGSYTERKFDRATVDTSGIERQWDEIISLTKEKQEKADMEAERQALNDYLRQYGTYQEQRLAIAEEYGRKIREAEAADTPEAQKRLNIATLRAERRKAEGEVSDRRILSDVDWVTTFGRLGSSFEAVIEDALGKINAYIATDDFASRPADEKKEVLTARQGLQDYVGNRSTFAGLDRELTTLTERVSVLREAEAAHQSAISQVAMAEAALAKTQKKDSVQYAAASARLRMAKENEATSGEAVREAGEAVATQQTAVADTAGDLQKNLDKLSQGLQGLSSGSLGQTVEGLKQLMQSVGLSTKAFGKFQKTLGDTLSAVLGDELGGLLANSLDTVQGLLTGELSASIIAAVTGMVDNIVKGILSGGFIMKPLEALKDGLGSLADTLTFGGFSSLFGADGNSKRVAEVTERLTKQNERLENSVEKLTAKIDETAGGTAIKSYEEAYAAQQRLTENKRTILDEQQGYHAAHHSNAYYWGLDKDSLRQVNALLGTQLRNEWGDFAQLTAEQMDAIRSHLPDIWTEMLEQGKYDKGEWFEGYADQAGKLEELTAKINENLMGVSFSSLRDDFLSTLMDMESGTEEFGDKFKETMQKAVLNAMLGNAMDEKLKAWYDRLAKTMQEAGGVLTNAQITEARGEYDKMVGDMLALRDQASAITGYTGESAYRQEASVGAWQGMSEDTAEELNGRFTAVQINTAQTAERMIAAMETMAALTQGQAAANALLSDISYGIGVGNSHLEDMVKLAKMTYTQFGQKLDDLNTNIKRL